MSRRARDGLLGVALTLVTLAGVLWQVDQSAGRSDPDGRTSLPRLVCPLH